MEQNDREEDLYNLWLNSVYCVAIVLGILAGVALYILGLTSWVILVAAIAVGGIIIKINTRWLYRRLNILLRFVFSLAVSNLGFLIYLAIINV